MNSINTVSIVKSHTNVEFHANIKRVPTITSAVVATDREASTCLVVAVNEDATVDGGFLVHMYLQSPKEIAEFGLAMEKQEDEYRPGPYLGNLIKAFLEGIASCEDLIEISSGRMIPGWVKA